MLSFSSLNYIVSETENNIMIMVQRSGKILGSTSVDYSIISNATYSAQLGIDFQAMLQGTLQFNANETEQFITITVINDDTPETDDRLLLQLFNPINATLTSTTAVLTITDDDTPGMLEFSASDYSVLESATTATITVNRINGVGGAVSVRYATANGTAIAIEDYSSVTNTLNWVSGDTSAKTFDIIIINDNVAEPTQSLNINLLLSSLTGGATLGSTTNALLSIIDDDTAVPARSSLEFFVDDGIQEDYAQQTAIPTNFGVADFSLQLWIKPNNIFKIGATRPGAGGDPYINWSDTNNPPGIGDWWFDGNFLLDGHNNSASGWDGTFSLQIYGSGRLRWLFHDGAADFWAVQGDPTPAAPYLLDGNWHQITLIRRCINNTSADLEMWVNGKLISTNTSDRCSNMRDYWDTWSNFPAGQFGWFWGAEKQAAISSFKWEDYKGLIDEIRFWSYALSSEEISTGYGIDVIGDENGLVGLFRLDEGLGNSACNSIVPTECIDLINNPNAWSNTIAPIQ